MITRMVSTRKMKNQKKKELSQLNKTLGKFVKGINTKECTIVNETFRPQSDGCLKNTEKIIIV